MIVLEKLSIAGRERPRLQDVSLRLELGEQVTVIGENGAGKSTFLDVLAGILPVALPESYSLNTRFIDKYSLVERSKLISSMPQRDEAPSVLSVERRILQGTTPARGSEALYDENSKKLLENLLDELELTTFRKRRLGELSGGERRRVHVARCLAHEKAKIFLLDEPFAGVDRKQSSIILSALQKRSTAGALVVTSVHDLDLAATLAERVIGFHHGKVLVDAPMRQALNEKNIFRIYQKKGRLVEKGVSLSSQENLFGVLFEREHLP